MSADFKEKQMAEFRKTKLEEYKKIVKWQSENKIHQEIKARIKERRTQISHLDKMSKTVGRDLKHCTTELNRLSREKKRATCLTAFAIDKQLDHFTERKETYTRDLNEIKRKYDLLKSENEIDKDKLNNGWKEAVGTTNPFEQ